MEDKNADEKTLFDKTHEERLEEIKHRKHQPDHKKEWLEGWAILKTLLANPAEVVREIWEDNFPPVDKSKASSQSVQSVSTAKSLAVQKLSAGGQTATTDSCRVCTHQEKTADGRTVFSHSFYSRSALDAISFDPFVVEADISHDTARSQGIFGLMRVKREAWLEERMTDATVSKLQSRQRILEEQRRTTEVGHRLHQAIHTPAPQSPPSRSPAPTQQASRALPSLAPLRPSVTNDQIEGAAIRALLEGVRSEQDWAIYEEALNRHFPPYAVQEVKDRLSELLTFNPDGPS